MTEQEMRALVREAIARQLGKSSSPWPAEAREGDGQLLSYMQFAIPSGPEGTCVIEPSVMCNHCGFCKSYGH